MSVRKVPGHISEQGSDNNLFSFGFEVHTTLAVKFVPLWECDAVQFGRYV
jgi:hypothetical protein